VEYIPEYIAKGVGAMYVYEGYAERLKLNNFVFDLSTQYCGTKYSKVLTTNADKKINIFDAFIDKYSIDMSIYERTNYEDYVSVNDWFTRPLAANVRPIAMPNNDSVIVSPADARLMCFDNVDPDSRFWIKGEDFNIEDLIGSESYKPAFENAQLSIVRLSPQDYHRFHVPASGTITRIQQIKGGLHSVNADGMTSGNYAIYNTRTVVMIQTENYGEIAYVPIGATCVGSIVLLVEEGDTVTKGDELGYFQFGGSTVAMVFEEGSVQFEEDIMLHSKDLVESLTTVNSRLATFL
jgi:phosphatidylserine decarboxylase